MCGLKLYQELEKAKKDKSHPVWVCGLKQEAKAAGSNRTAVTPCMGVWIETSVFDINPQVNQVTPCMGVWIETKMLLQVLALL